MGSNVTLPSQYNTLASQGLGKIVSNLMEKPTSVWSLAFHLRVFLHVFTDIHQPQHVGEYFDEVFPDGLWGGHRLRCIGEPCDSIPGVWNFHNFWDAGVGNMTKLWSFLVKDDNAYVTRRAAEVMVQSPADPFIHGRSKRLSEYWNNADNNYGFGEGLIVNFTAAIKHITDDSMDRWSSIYGEYYSNASRDGTYKPSADYIRIGQDAARSQIALAGYRLASWLNALAPYIPDEAPCDLSAPAPDIGKDYDSIIFAYRIGILMTAIATFVTGGVVGWFYARRRKHNVEIEASLAPSV